MYNVMLERIHQVLGTLVRNFNVQQAYVDKMTRGRAFWLHQSFQFSQQPVEEKVIVWAN